MDKNLLLSIFHIPAMSTNESEMREFIENYLDSYNIPYEEDSVGNVFNISNKNRPLLSAHMDTVQDVADEKLAKFISIRGNILSGLGVIGADDKNGIYIILEMLRETPDINFAFFVEEEVGTVGSKYFMDKKFIDLGDIPYGIVLDRRGAGDIICEVNNYGTLEFEVALEREGKEFGYTSSIGAFSDADSLSEEISCANLSVGYYNAHSKAEYVKLDELENALNYVRHIVENITKQFEAPEKVYTYSKYDSHGYNRRKKTTNDNYWEKYGYSDDYEDDFGSGIERCSLCEKYKSELTFLPTQDKYVCSDCYEDLTNSFSNTYLGDKESLFVNKDNDITNEEIDEVLKEL